MNQGKLDMVNQERSSLNINMLGNSGLNLTEWVNLIQMTIIPTTPGKNPLEELE